MLLQFTLLLATVSLLSASTGLMETSRIAVDYDFSGKPIPKWQGGALLVTDASFGSAVRLSVFDKEGIRIQDHWFQIDGKKHLTVRDFTRSADGTLAVCGSMVDFAGKSGAYIAFIHPTDKSVNLVQTSPFQPMRMTATANGAFWVAGYETNPLPPGAKPRTSLAEAVNKDASLFRHFDKSGKLLLSSVPHSSVEDPISMAQPASVFAEIGNEIIWYTNHSRQLFAISQDGSFTEVRDLELPADQHQTGFGISAKGEIIVSTLGNDSWSVLKLLPSRRHWQSLAQGVKGDRSNPPIMVIGSEGNAITALGGGNTGIRTFLLVD